MGNLEGGSESDLMRPRHNMWIFNHLPVCDEPMLVCMISGTLAEEMVNMSTSTFVSRVLAAIRIPFPKAPAPAGVAVGRWDLNEFTLGGWSFHKPGWRGAADVD